MNIRPKNTILFAQTGVKFSQNNLGGANWRQQVFNNYRQHLLDQLSKYGEAQDYGDWLNEMQSRHANIYDLAGGEKGNWQNVAYKNNLVGQYQHDYKGDKRFGTIKLNEGDTYDFNQGISPNFSTRYNIANPPSRVSGDNSTKKFAVDNLYSAITDDRRLLGRKGDWDESSTEFKQWQNDLKSRGWETYLDTNDNYYKLRKFTGEIDGGNPLGDKEIVITPQKKVNETPAQEYKQPESIWTKLGQGLNKVAPDLLDALRLAGNMYNNERVYKESMKAIKPNLQQSYHTYRQVVGDEATKQGFYRRAAQGEQKAARPITSDLDKQIAYQNEAKRIGDELRAQGDLADNQRIRETSQESMAHADANRERDTTVANSNLTEMLKADAAKHQLTAQKYSADWTNLEQFLLGKQYKLEQKKAKEQELQNQLATLDIQDDLLGDSTLQNFKMQREKAYNDYIAAKTPQEQANLKKIFDEANLNYQKYYIQKQRDALHRKYQVGIAKEGVKITKKHKDTADKFLYKTSRDIVEHFRKMSKMTDDSRIKTLPKPIKLTSHPKKYQLGGVAPFTVYRPLGAGGENAVSTQTTSSTDSKSSKDTAAKDKLDMIKELFKAIQGQGLPIDVSTVYQEISGVLNKAKAFGEELSTDDIASMYLSSMQKINNLKYSKDVFDKAKAQATTNEALNEFAVTTGGKLVLQDREGKITTGTYADYVKSEGRLNPITNDQLLNLRAYSPDLALWKGDELMQIVNNGVGMNKIATQIKSMAASIGSTENKIEGISQVESNKVKAGLQILAGTDGTPDGYYKVTKDSKDSQAKVQAALNYIIGMLPNNYKTILDLHSGGKSKELIASFLTSQTSDFVKEDITPLSGKASDKETKDEMDKLGINSAVQLLLGMSSPREFTFNIGNGNSFQGAARVSSITNDGNPVGSDFSYSEIYKSDLHKNLDLDNASFGDVPINKALKDRIIIDNSTIAGVDLPYTTDRNGRIIPDFKMLNKIEEADQEILKAGINPDQEPQKANEIYAKHGLPIKYGADNRLSGNYKRFAVVQATAIEDVFLNKDGLASNGTLTLVSDDNEVEKYVNELKKITGQKEIDMDRPGIFTGDKDIYKGSIFIPIIGDLVDAVSATGGLKAGIYDDLRSKYETRNYNKAPQFVKQ